jgi:hypothetical protein
MAEPLVPDTLIVSVLRTGIPWASLLKAIGTCSPPA